MKISFLYGITAVILSLAVGVPADSDPQRQTESEKPDSVVTHVRTERRGGFVNFSFDKVDIRFLVKLVGDLTGRRFVIDKEIEGKITVVTPPKIPISEVYPLFVSILEASGCAVVERDGIYHIVAREARATPIVPVLGPDKILPEEGMITKVIRIGHLSAVDVSKILEPMVAGSKTGGLGVLEATNHLIITDTADSLRRIEEIIKQIDKPGMTRVVEIHKLRYADAWDMANEMNLAISGGSSKVMTRGERLKQRLPRPGGKGALAPGAAIVVAAPHSNSLILVGTSFQVADLKLLIERMDVEPVSGYGHLRVIFLKYLSSEEAAKSLTALLAKGVEKPQNQKIAIESSISNNALLINAAPKDFEMVKKLIAQLDYPPQQVLIEVMFAEITAKKGHDFGVEFLASGSPSEGSSVMLGGMRTAEEEDSLMSTIMSGVVPAGLTFGVARGSYTDSDGNVIYDFPALININAIEENYNFKVLSNVPLWTQNNQEASVNIGKNIPILKSTIEGGAGTARDIIQNIERIDVGIKLTVTPHVNPNCEVLMKLNLSIEAVVETSTGGLDYTPTIAKREVTTTLTVPNNETVVISGLIREDEVSAERRIPILGSIPLLGWLFRHSVKSVERTNLLIFVTPHVVTNINDVAKLTNRFKSQTGISTNMNVFIP